jgi:hypothetical protein
VLVKTSKGKTAMKTITALVVAAFAAFATIACSAEAEPEESVETSEQAVILDCQYCRGPCSGGSTSPFCVECRRLGCYGYLPSGCATSETCKAPLK